MSEWDSYEVCNYPPEVFPRPIRRVIRFVILFNLSVLMVGAVVFSIYSGTKVVREVTANPGAYQTKPTNHAGHVHSPKGQRP